MGLQPKFTRDVVTNKMSLYDCDKYWILEQKIEFILGVGGGSVADGAKFIACAALYEGDGWDIVSGKYVPTEALPVGVVLTLPATGS